jgi:hypothetical protein
MANNNNQLFDAALTSFFAAANVDRGVPTPIPALEVTAAQAFATEVDSLIPVDAAIVTPATSETLAKVNLLGRLCFAALSGRVTLTTPASTYATIAASIVASYNQIVALLALP